jgi:hypothetical protein
VCHNVYAKETLPVPAVNVVTLKDPSVVVEEVKPPPGLEMV